jgi:hypothetical protein
VLSDSLAIAFDRLDDFAAVQGSPLSTDAVLLLQESVGIADPERRLILERLASLQPPGRPTPAGAVLLGILIGLSAAELGG